MIYSCRINFLKYRSRGTRHTLWNDFSLDRKHTEKEYGLEYTVQQSTVNKNIELLSRG